MRQPCIQCFRKHIGNAAVLIEEVLDGYVDYEHMVVGHLDQAAQEIRRYSPTLAHLVRAHRIKWQDDTNYDIPFEAFDSFARTLSLLDLEPGGKDWESVPDIPDECYEGLDKLASGDGYNLMTGDMR